MHRGSVVRDKSIMVEILCCDPSGFSPDPDKERRTSTIDDCLTSFVNVCLLHILPMSKGIGYLSNLYVNNLRKPKPPSADADEDRRLTIVVFCVVPLLTRIISNVEPERVRCSVWLSILNSGVKVF
jgi:hypothetical protein